MVDILHRVGVVTPSPEKVYDALTTVDGLSAWWTDDTRGSGEVGGVLEFRFPPVGGFDMEVVEVQPARTRRAGASSTARRSGSARRSTGELRQDGDYTIVLFAHAGWSEPVEFMHHCSTKWGSYLMSLKSFVETGTGAPAPRDVQISDWH